MLFSFKAPLDDSKLFKKDSAALPNLLVEAKVKLPTVHDSGVEALVSYMSRFSGKTSKSSLNFELQETTNASSFGQQPPKICTPFNQLSISAS